MTSISASHLTRRAGRLPGPNATTLSRPSPAGVVGTSETDALAVAPNTLLADYALCEIDRDLNATPMAQDDKSRHKSLKGLDLKRP